jgi:acetyl esterase/lipase
MLTPRAIRAPQRDSTGVRMRVLTAMTALTVLGSCAAGPPPRSTVANDWGRDLEPTLTDLAYGPEEHQRLDVLHATGPNRRGTLVFVHGGAFKVGHRSDLFGGDHGAVVRQHTRGWDIVSVSYLLGQGGYPTPMYDVALAVSWVREHAEAAGLDTTKVMIVGHSAGGSLAAMVATRPGTITPYGSVPRVDGWVAISALHDWTSGGWYISDPWGMPASHRSAMSPINSLDRSDPPGYLIHADEDPIVSRLQSSLMFDRARSIGADVQFDRITSGPRECRLHVPLCGADFAALSAFLT